MYFNQALFQHRLNCSRNWARGHFDRACQHVRCRVSCRTRDSVDNHRVGTHRLTLLPAFSQLHSPRKKGRGQKKILEYKSVVITLLPCSIMLRNSRCAVSPPLPLATASAYFPNHVYERYIRGLQWVVRKRQHSHHHNPQLSYCDPTVGNMLGINYIGHFF